MNWNWSSVASCPCFTSCFIFYTYLLPVLSDPDIFSDSASTPDWLVSPALIVSTCYPSAGVCIYSLRFPYSCLSSSCSVLPSRVKQVDFCRVLPRFVRMMFLPPCGFFGFGLFVCFSFFPLVDLFLFAFYKINNKNVYFDPTTCSWVLSCIKVVTDHVHCVALASKLFFSWVIQKTSHLDFYILPLSLFNNVYIYIYSPYNVFHQYCSTGLHKLPNILQTPLAWKRPWMRQPDANND